MIAFDSNILIYFLERHRLFGEKAENLLRATELTGGVCSTLVITETMYGTIDTHDKITPLLSTRISVLPVSSSIAVLAGEIKLKYGLKNVDAIHVATAITAKAAEFVTNDQTLINKKILEIKIRGL